MAEKKSFPPKVFQQCTIQKVVDELFNSKRSGPRRFLVADEVGLGKTIVAKHVINHLRQYAGRQIVIYVSSSLDITKQNRIKLAEHPDKEIVHADRINLLYQEKELSRGLQIISMTPGTSLNTSRSLGSANERAFICAMLRRNYQVRRSKLADIFHGMSDRDNFLNRIKHVQQGSCPLTLEKKICSRLDRIKLNSGFSFLEALGASSLSSEEKSDLIKQVRHEMAQVILENLNPSLVIFDEFQKFREITETDDFGNLTHPLGKILLTNETPTLLLSATPYRLYADDDIFSGNDQGSHYSDLQRTFTFITGSKRRASEIVGSIQKYGSQIQNLNESNVREILELKDTLQEDVMRHMSRAERINFEGQNESNIETVFMGDAYMGDMITKENILEFLRLAEHSGSKKTLLTYWKSGTHSMSYLEKYKLVEGAVLESKTKGSSLESNKELYSKLQKHPSQHLKVKYLYDELLKAGEAYSYLWLQPTIPYYRGTGIFSEDKINELGPKKGLVFSSWMFVPRMVAGELGAMRGGHFKRIPKDKEIKPSGESWARLFFPSSLLASSLTHRDFAEAKSYGELVKKAKEHIRQSLTEQGFQFIDKGKSLPLYHVLSHCEFFENEEKYKGYKGLLKGKGRWNVSSNREPGNYLKSKKLPIFIKDPELVIDKATLQVLAETAVSSPSVCILRAMNHLRKNDVTWKSWLQLSSFCFYDIRSFVNRSGHLDAILKVGNGSKPVAKAVDYFKKGNFQAVIDEYLYQVFSNKSDEGVFELLKKLSQIFGPTKAYCKVKTSRFKSERVYNDVVCCFGDGAEQSNSRDLNREAFNSPFWPFVLATTSVGQEGLDFHLYCKDIYHWNLPTNPVDFEQREGRINRFNNFMIRQNIVKARSINPSEIERSKSVWDLYLNQARRFAQRADRYNLEMSPNWVFTPKSVTNISFKRHVMDLPCSNDRDVYVRLMQDLDLYRLALGQPNQREFMEKLRSNDYYQKIDPRGIILNFFPHHLRNRKAEVAKYIDDQEELKLLIEDCRDYLKEIKGERLYDELLSEVERHIARVTDYAEGKASKAEFKASIEALYYFVDPFDEHSDRDPEVGFEDDLEVLKAA